MTGNITTLSASGFEMKAAEKLLEDTNFSGFPIVEDTQGMILLGYIGRTELRFAIDRARKQGLTSPSAKCAFIPHRALEDQTPSTGIPPITFDSIATSSGQQNIDFSQFVDSTPIAVHPRLPLETVMELFKKMGPRVILVEHRGQLTGLVTVKDCLKYQFKVEAQEHASRDESLGEARQEKLWDAMQKAGDWIADRISALSSGRLKLSPRIASASNGWAGLPSDDATAERLNVGEDHSNARTRDRDQAILDGTEDIDDGVELDDR